MIQIHESVESRQQLKSFPLTPDFFRPLMFNDDIKTYHTLEFLKFI